MAQETFHLQGPNSSVGRPVEGPPRRRRADVVPVLLCADIVALSVAGTLVGPGSTAVLAFGAASLVALIAGREYHHRLSLSALDAAPRVASRLAVALFAVAVGGFLLNEVPSVVLVQAPLSVAAVLVGRVISTGFIRRQRRRGRMVHPAVILGAGNMGVELASLLDQYPEYGLRPVGIVDDVAPVAAPVPLLGPISELRNILSSQGIAHVVMAFSPTRGHHLVKVVRSTVLDDVEVYVMPRFFDVGLAQRGSDVECVGGIPLHRVRGSALRSHSFPAKRMFDVAVSGIVLLALAPLLAAMAIAVRMSSPGPILFHQQRVGQNGRFFEMLKFRTMRVNDDADFTWSVSDDDRLTGVGRILRRLSLDELPQLLNIVVGEMSLVGPRPERPFFVDQFVTGVKGYDERHRLPVGLTGLAQVHGLRGDTSIEQRVRLDNYYIEHWSPWRDLMILCATFGEVLRNASAGLSRRAFAESRPPDLER
jgi:exopolysaccharide biosynthesis polyprenyl glycosylphosphotransferase